MSDYTSPSNVQKSQFAHIYLLNVHCIYQAIYLSFINFSERVKEPKASWRIKYVSADVIGFRQKIRRQIPENTQMKVLILDGGLPSALSEWFLVVKLQQPVCTCREEVWIMVTKWWLGQNRDKVSFDKMVTTKYHYFVSGICTTLIKETEWTWSVIPATQSTRTHQEMR